MPIVALFAQIGQVFPAMAPADVDMQREDIQEENPAGIAQAVAGKTGAVAVGGV